MVKSRSKNIHTLHSNTNEISTCSITTTCDCELCSRVRADFSMLVVNYNPCMEKPALNDNNVVVVVVVVANFLDKPQEYEHKKTESSL